MPTEKFVVGGDSASEVMKSNDQANEDLQGMYDRILGNNSAAGVTGA